MTKEKSPSNKYVISCDINKYDLEKTPTYICVLVKPFINHDGQFTNRSTGHSELNQKTQYQAP